MVLSRTFLLALAALAAVGILIHTAVDPQSWPRQRRLTADLVRLRSDNEAMEERVNQLRSTVQALRTRPEVQERAVRDELGWVRDGDWVIHFGTHP